MDLTRDIIEAESEKRQALTTISEQLSVINNCGFDTEVLRSAFWRYTKAFAAAYCADQLMRIQMAVEKDFQNGSDRQMVECFRPFVTFKRCRIVIREGQSKFTLLSERRTASEAQRGVLETSSDSKEALAEKAAQMASMDEFTGRHLLIDWTNHKFSGDLKECEGDFETKPFNQI